MKKIKAILVDVEKENVKVIEIERNLDTYYKLIGCQCIDIVTRSIGGKLYDIICDDEGLFYDKPKISAIDKHFQPMLVGNLIITGVANNAGNLTSLTDDDVEHVMKYVREFRTNFFPDGYKVVCDCGYEEG